MRRHLTAAVAVALVLGVAACRTGGEARPRETDDGPTVWQVIQESGDDEGRMGVQGALQAFAYLFGPLPGVRVPSARPDPPGFAASGTSQIGWVFAHWKELTDEQRRAVTARLAPPPGEPPRFGQSVKDRAATILAAEVRDLVAKIAARLGGNVTIPPARFYLVDKDEPNVRAWTVPMSGPESIEPGTRDSVDIRNGPAAKCPMFFPPSIWTNVAGGVPAVIKQTIAHEIFHCFQAFNYADLALYRTAGNWLNDGSAEFAGTDLAGVSFPPSWEHYLRNRASLFDRVDSAAGWWFHLRHIGRDPWKLLPTVWQQGLTGPGAYVHVGGDRDDFYDTWASSFLRMPGFGDAWDVHGVDVPATHPPRSVVAAGQGPLEVGPLDVKVAEVRTIDPDFDGLVLVSSAYPVRVHDGAGFEDVHVTAGDYCLGEKCVCPDNTERAGERFQRVQRPLWVALPGGESGNAILADAVSLEDYCKKQRPQRRKPPKHPQPTWAHPHAPATNPHGPDPKPTTRPKAGSTGDPHLTSLGGHSFDFQAAGEFTLIRSTDGDLEVQVRQQPATDFAGRESDTVTVNTAVAARVAGARVAIVADGDRLAVRVDGKPASVDGGHRLPDGGSIEPVDTGFLVRWPDGSQLWATVAAPGSVNVLFGPAESWKGKLHGLLGPFDGVPGSTAMTDRDGKRYDKASTDELYDEIGESWRIEQDDSLFDYRPGESTDTFTDRDVPAKQLTLDDLPADRRAAGERACAGVEMHDECVFDVALSGNDKFAAGYRTLDKLHTVGGGDLALDRRIGPDRLEPGQQRTFTHTSNADALYFASDADCATPTSATVWWRVTAPDGTETLQVPMCADAGRRTTTKPGAWRIDVWVPPGAESAGLFALHLEAAGALRTVDIDPPETVEDTLSGAGAETRYRFDASTGGKLTLKSRLTCDDDRALYWGLEAPDGNRVTLRTRACQDLGEHTITTSGTWSVVVYNHTDDRGPHGYAFSVS